MASAKRKQDEKNLKTLRELVSQPGNKECFECRQRGPTYVDMTIGSFVCTSCSGILRGLTPPHRVKSISMATFTQDEINFLREHGNEHCRGIWLGLLQEPYLFNSDQLNVDTKDEKEMKNMMVNKYELKRYYLDPLENDDDFSQSNANAKVQTTSTRSAGNANLQTKAVPRVPNPATSTTVPVQSKARPEPAQPFVPDFVADFSKVPDPFSIASPVKNSMPIPPQPSFANFDNNPIFNNTKNAESLFDHKAGPLTSNLNGINAPPPEDRYAALKDLDSLMKQAQLKEENSQAKSTWNSNNSNAPNLNWSSLNNSTTHVISNPFTSGDLWRPSVNLVNNNLQPIDSSFCTNPFRPTHFAMNNDSLWSGRESQNNEDVISSSQLMTSLSGKTWQPSVTAYHANPFMVGSGVNDMSRNSNNPFL